MRRNPGQALTIVLLLAACGPQRPDLPGNGPDGRPGGGPDSGPGGGDGSPPTGDGCPDESKLIYVVDGDTDKLSQFQPQTKTFTDLGVLACSASSPFSMAIARDATAWVLYQNGELFRVDTKNNLACTKSTWAPGTQGLLKFGMGFSTDQVGGTTDTLFISGGGSPTTDSTSTLARLNLSSFQPSKIGTVTDWPELTGTGNAELWGFFPSGNNARIVKLDKTNGAALQTYRQTVLDDPDPAAWAFAFHGGSFWVFLQKETENETFIYQFNAGTRAQVGQRTGTGRKIVGAGVSTCAPIIL
jgi:hypothetical protein